MRLRYEPTSTSRVDGELLVTISLSTRMKSGALLAVECDSANTTCSTYKDKTELSFDHTK